MRKAILHCIMLYLYIYKYNTHVFMHSMLYIKINKCIYI